MKLSYLSADGDIRGNLTSILEAVEKSGYDTFWVSEHQPEPSPVLVASLLLNASERIAIGIGASLLRSYHPARLASDFRLLRDVHADRFRPGICAGRALVPKIWEPKDSGGYEATRAAFMTSCGLKIRAKLNVLEECFEMGGGPRTAKLAAESGTSFAYTLFHHQSVDSPDAVKSYRNRFKPSHFGSEPYVAVALGGIAAPTEGEAQDRHKEHKNKFIVPTVCGSYEHVAREIRKTAERYQADEILYVDFNAKRSQKIEAIEAMPELVSQVSTLDIAATAASNKPEHAA